jgi:hypothetical protein
MFNRTKMAFLHSAGGKIKRNKRFNVKYTNTLSKTWELAYLDVEK